MIRWAVKHARKNRLDGYRAHFESENLRPLLFMTRTEAREHIGTRHGYIAKRPDLRREPHGWMMPKAVRVEVRLIEVIA